MNNIENINMFSRLEIAIGKDNLEKIKNSKIIVFGLGGVGSYAVETLVRSGIKNITIVDADKYSVTNMNRQLYAIKSTIGKNKVDVAKDRILEINDNCNVNSICKKVYKNIDEFNLKEYDFVIDCIDTIMSKIEIIKYCQENNIKFISSMGFGNKFCPEKIKISKIFKTVNCPLARTIRNLSKKHKLKNFDVVYSDEICNNRKFIHPKTEEEIIGNVEIRKLSPASNAFVPPVAGIIITSYVIRKIIGYL